MMMCRVCEETFACVAFEPNQFQRPGESKGIDTCICTYNIYEAKPFPVSPKEKLDTIINTLTSKRVDLF